MYVDAEIDGDATPEQLAVLEADPVTWRASLLALLRDAEEHLASARQLRGEEREQVLADLESEHRRLAAAWARHTGQRNPEPGTRSARSGRIDRDDRADGDDRDASRASSRFRSRGSRVGSSRGRRAVTRGRPRSKSSRRCSRRRVPRSLVGQRHGPVPLPGGVHADAQAIPCW